ncbi:MAG: GtrA family protein [Acidimicrobiales bacterium]|jgi:putative flippase GtrA
MAAEIQELTTISAESLTGVSEVDAFIDLTDPSSVAARLRALWRDRQDQIALVARYATTSVVAFGVSEIALLLLYGKGITSATVSAVIANLVGTVPSYFMSRYWIWKDADRRRAGRQVVLYWATSAACIALTSLATGAIARLAPAGHPLHLEVVAIGFPAVTILFWFAKLFVYQRVIFRTAKAERIL